MAIGFVVFSLLIYSLEQFLLLSLSESKFGLELIAVQSVFAMKPPFVSQKNIPLLISAKRVNFQYLQV